MLEKARDKGLMKGRSFNKVLGGIIYIVARDNHEPRTLDEISEVLRISKRDLGNSYRYVGRELGEKIFPPPPEDYIPRFAEKLDLSQETADKAIEIIKVLLNRILFQENLLQVSHLQHSILQPILQERLDL